MFFSHLTDIILGFLAYQTVMYLFMMSPAVCDVYEVITNAEKKENVIASYLKP